MTAETERGAVKMPFQYVTDAIRQNSAVILLFSYLFGSAVCNALVISPTRDGWWLSIKVLALPLAIVTLWLFRKEWKARSGFDAKLNLILFTCVAYPASLLMAGPYLQIAGALLPASASIEYRGPVIAKDTVMARGIPSAYLLQIVDRNSEEIVEFEVPLVIAINTSVGDEYGRCFYLSPFGTAYRWQYGDRQPICLHSR